MLGSIFGCKSVEKILIFLFVNEKCYGAQLHRLLSTPLTPIQKALLRLENSGIILSYYEGKTRLYHFNPSYPLLNELQSLLKGAYTLLSPQEKKLYSFVKNECKTRKKGQLSKLQSASVSLVNFWTRLCAVRKLTFISKSKNDLGHNGKGNGDVVISKEGDNVLIFHEKGCWKGENGHELDFSNTFRWTIDRLASMVSLEHLRRGMNHPVFLFHLIPIGSNALECIDSHLCGGDTYFGKIAFDANFLQLHWRIIGPKKNEEINYYYT
jgi:hypothetical protein